MPIQIKGKNALPDEIFGGDPRGFNCSTDQTAPSNINPPEIHPKKKEFIKIHNELLKIQQIDNY